jgi:hypothetical protein
VYSLSLVHIIFRYARQGLKKVWQARLRQRRAKHADRQRRASQRCIFIAPEDKLMKRILNASPPVQPATSRAVGTLHDESDSKPAEEHPSTHRPASQRPKRNLLADE